jgi:hypothetical protein
MLQAAPGIRAVAIFEEICRRHPEMDAAKQAVGTHDGGLRLPRGLGISEQLAASIATIVCTIDRWGLVSVLRCVSGMPPLATAARKMRPVVMGQNPSRAIAANPTTRGHRERLF